MSFLPVPGTVVDVKEPHKPLRKISAGQLFRNQSVLLLMSVPFVIHLIVFRFGPLYGWVMAFQNYRPGRPFSEQEWVGLQQFRFLFDDRRFWEVMRNTIGMAFINLAMGTFFAVFIAIMINETKHRLFKRSVQTISYLPHFISWVVASHLWREILMPRGIINALLMRIGILESPVLFLGEQGLFWWIIGWSHVWKTAGFGAIIYLAAMTSVDPQLYEAADIDGASRLQRIYHITLPGIRSVFVILLIMNIGFVMQSGFEQQYLMQNTLVEPVSEVFMIYVLRYGLQLTRFSYATAAGIFQSVVSISLILVANFIAGKLGEETLL